MKSLLLASFLVLSACAPQILSTTNVPEETSHEIDHPDAGAVPAVDALPAPVVPSTTVAGAEAILDGYQNLDPQHVVPTALLEKAVVYYDANKASFANHTYIVVVDFTKNSAKKRFFVVNLVSGAVASYYVAHGKGSDPDFDGFATKFSNTANSEMSSLGFYRTRSTYTGTHGRSLRLEGLSSTNSNVLSREIVVHGASYVQNAPVKQGRSWGCFALPMSQKDAVITQIQNGALIYAGLSGEK